MGSFERIIITLIFRVNDPVVVIVGGTKVVGRASETLAALETSRTAPVFDRAAALGTNHTDTGEFGAATARRATITATIASVGSAFARELATASGAATGVGRIAPITGPTILDTLELAAENGCAYERRAVDQR